MALISITKFSDISKRHLLRFGARYVDFWKNREGKVFDTYQSSIKIKEIASFASGKVIKKEQIDKAYLLIDLANIEPETGYPVALENNIVSDIGSDKVYLSDADLVFSKLNSHIGYVFLIDEMPNEGYDLIGSTEFFPLKINSSVIHPKLLKYFLLHHSFREIAVFLRSGKSQSHPRIQKDDFFNLKIPQLSNEIQKTIVKRIEEIESRLNSVREKIEDLIQTIDEIFTKYGISTKPRIKRGDSYFLKTALSNLAKTKWISCRPYLCRFVEEELPDYINNNLKNSYIEFGRYIKHLSSGEYIPQKYYSDFETDYVYLKIGNVSSNEFNFDEITYLNQETGIQYNHIRLLDNDLIISRSGTVGKCVIYDNSILPSKTILPSHHLAVVRLESLSDALFLKYYIQSSFGSDFLWAFSTGKVQKEITNWSIKNIPIPNIDNRDKIVEEIQIREAKSKLAYEEIKKLRADIDDLILAELELCAKPN